MRKKAVEVEVEEPQEVEKAPRKKKVARLDAQFSRVDLQQLADKVNELVEAHNAA